MNSKPSVLAVIASALGIAFGHSASAQSPSAYSTGTSTQVSPTATSKPDFGPVAPLGGEDNFAAAIVAPDASPADRHLTVAVINALAADPALRGADLSVDVKEGQVTMTGTAADATQARHAAGVAMGIAGVPHVTSAIATR